MRGMCWNSDKYELNAMKKVKKAIEKDVLIAEYDKSQCKYFFDKTIDPSNKRHTKGYYYALTHELFGIIQSFCINADEKTIAEVKEKRLEIMTKRMEKLKQS